MSTGVNKVVAAHYEQYSQYVVTALFNCNNMVDNIVHALWFTPVDINLEHPVRF
jgi:hypothetical protein